MKSVNIWTIQFIITRRWFPSGSPNKQNKLCDATGRSHLPTPLFRSTQIFIWEMLRLPIPGVASENNGPKVFFTSALVNSEHSNYI